ncbi:MAG: glycosyltransferase [Capsulimonadaceae bacterium]
MRILRIINSTDPKHGGPIEGVKQISAVFAARGHQTEVACLDSPDDPWIPGFPLKVHALGPSTPSYRYSPAFAPWLTENARRFDCIFVHGVWLYSNYGAWQVLTALSIPYFVYTHGILDPWFKHAYPLKHAKKSVYWILREHKVLRDAKAVLFTTEEERILARQSFKPFRCHEVVVSYGTSRAPQGAPAFRESFHREFPELAGKRIVLFLGRIHNKKGCDLMIQAMARVADRDPALVAVMAGPDQTGWKSQLQGLAEKEGIGDRVKWTGMLTGDLKWGAFYSADVFMLPSHAENFGIAVVEALGCGLPVLVTNKVNIWREIQADSAGIVADDTLDGATSLIDQWLSLDSVESGRMRVAARACFDKRFDIENVASSLLRTLYEHGVSGAGVA